MEMLKSNSLSLQVRQVVLDLLGTQLPEAGSRGTFDSLVSQEAVLWWADNA